MREESGCQGIRARAGTTKSHKNDENKVREVFATLSESWTGIVRRWRHHYITHLRCTDGDFQTPLASGQQLPVCVNPAITSLKCSNY